MRRIPIVNTKNPDDWRELNAQIDAEPELWRMEAKAYDPTVKIENEIFPHSHEVYNCTNCTRAAGPEHPAHKLKSPESYKVKCGPLGLFPGVYQTAPRWNDIGCPMFDRRVTRDIEAELEANFK